MTRPLARRNVLAGMGGLAVASRLISPARAAEPRVLVGLLDEDPPIINPGVDLARARLAS